MAKPRTARKPAALNTNDCIGSRVNCEGLVFFFPSLPQTFHWYNEKRCSAPKVGVTICYYSSINREQRWLLQSFCYISKIVLVSLIVVLGLAFVFQGTGSKDLCL